ncbi:hypothetical protein [Aquabacter sediminis]|uniref:hypothetical protein n=1 Tax=Aquabacter sediminis TaxID=3029197 RepID=UPI00237E9D43|nr:hypothetical protein [Aquabacter sp. P-9]MDE1568801.1 hypothetical protein [Aquabacter sp. P-9]
MSADEYDEDAEFELLAQRARELRAKSPNARAFLEVMAMRERDPSSTSISRIAKIIRSDRSAAVDLAKELQKAGFGAYVVGRRGNVSRFEWEWSASSLGQAAAGAEVDVARIDRSQLEAEEEPDEREEEAAPAAPSLDTLTLTIPQAKAALSRTLGVPVENIEIIIRG